MLSSQQILEILGYTASVLVAVSLMMSSIWKLRVINLTGAILFSVYGFLIHAYPVGLLNGFIAVTNIYYLSRMVRTREYFTIQQFGKDSEYLACFLDFYKEEIKNFQPSFEFTMSDTCLGLYVLRNLVIAGIFIAEKTGEGTYHISLDFVTKNYRDFKIGTYLLKTNRAYLQEKGVKKLTSLSGNKKHSGYLKKMGFKEAGSNSKGKMYELVLQQET